MTAKEKAEELLDRYETLGKDFTRGVSMKEFSKQCALIAVDEVLKSQKNIYGVNNKSTTFYLEVKQEIKQL
jgi:hypothetical protein